MLMARKVEAKYSNPVGCATLHLQLWLQTTSARQKPFKVAFATIRRDRPLLSSSRIDREHEQRRGCGRAEPPLRVDKPRFGEGDLPAERDPFSFSPHRTASLGL